MSFAERYEARRILAIGGGGLGGLLGGLLGGALDFVAPEVGIPLALATGGGSFLGQTAQNLVSGEPIGKAVTGGLESGAISGALSGVGEGLTTGNVLAAPGAAATGPLGSLFGGTSGDIGSGALGTAPITPVTGSALSAGGTVAPAVAPAAAAGGAPAAGAGAGAPVAGIAGTTGAAPGDVSGALSTSPATLTQSLGTTGPISGAADQDFSGGVTGAGGLGKLGSFIEGNPGLLLAGGGLAESLFKGNSIPGLGSLKTQAGLEATQGNQNLQALSTGQLPPGAQAQIDEAQQAAKANIASTFARLGMTGSTSEAQAQESAEQQAAAQKFTDLQQVAQLGLQEVGGANTLYNTIMTTRLQQDQETQNAIARLAAALAGSTGARATATA